MDDQQLLLKLYQFSSGLKVSGKTPAEELKKFRSDLTTALIQNPELQITGNRLHHLDAGEASSDDISDRLKHFSDFLNVRPQVDTSEPAPLIFKREVSVRSNLLGNSVPAWGTGMKPTQSYGPFTDEHGLDQWYDFFWPVKTIKVFLQGDTNPALLIPVSGLLSQRNSYKIEAGSVWISSYLIANNPALKTFYTGVKVTGGTLDCNAPVTITSGNIIILPGNAATLNLNLDQHVPAGPSLNAGFDATSAAIVLPKSLQLNFTNTGSAFTAVDASCTVFGNETQFKYQGASPLWIDFLSQLLIPYQTSTISNTPDTFQINSSQSKLCGVTGQAVIDVNSGWLLPVTQTTWQQLGEAAGIGALTIGLKKGITANWKGLKGGATSFTHPGIIVEPGIVSIIDFFAGNTRASQKLSLWNNSGSKFKSAITLGFGKAFPFAYISDTSGREIVSYFCNHKAEFDRPVDANGLPFKLQSSIALAWIVQEETIFKVNVLDNDLLFDGNVNNPAAYKQYAIALRNALFKVTAPYSLFLSGELEGDNQLKNGGLVLMYGVHQYLPTLPDPYVSSYTAIQRDPASLDISNLGLALAAFVKWSADKEATPLPENEGYLYFRFAAFDWSLITANLPKAADGAVDKPLVPATFQFGVGTFNRDIQTRLRPDITPDPFIKPVIRDITTDVKPVINIRDQFIRNINADELKIAANKISTNPGLNQVLDQSAPVDKVFNTVINSPNFQIPDLPADVSSYSQFSRGDRWVLPKDTFMLLDVSSNADQMGVSFGTDIRVNRNADGVTNFSRVDTQPGSIGPLNLPLQILNMDVVTSGQYVRAVTLPQISWEPVLNIPLPIEGAPDPADLVTVTPGLMVYDNDGIPTHIFSESPYLVPITPLSVVKHFIQEYNDNKVPREMVSTFTLPFAMVAQAQFNRSINNQEADNASLHFNMPLFKGLRGGLQIKAKAPNPVSVFQRNAFKGRTIQIDSNLKWMLFGLPMTGGTLGKTVSDIFNNVFSGTSASSNPKVPVEKMEISGYGASIFSNWLNDAAAVADVSQVKFDVLMGRTAHEVVQVRSVMYTCAGIVHVVRTVTLMRSPSGYVFRSDSGWKAESDAFFDCDYKIDFSADINTPDLKDINDPYTFHPGAIKGLSLVREIKDFPDGGTFPSSFSLNDTGLPGKIGKPTLADWKIVYPNLTSLDEKFKVELECVVFDCDVHLDNVISGGVPDPVHGGYKVQSRKMIGFVQLAPTGVLIPPSVYADLINFQNGSIGGPINCVINISGSNQQMRLSRADLSPALDAGGQRIFAASARGSLILPPDGAWSVVKLKTDAGDVFPVEEGQSVPLIKANGATNFKIANPVDVVQEAASKLHYAVLQSTGTQKLLFDIPQFADGVKKLFSNQTYYADAYKLLNSKGPFPNIANALQLTNAEKEIEIIGEGLMKMADREIDLGALLPDDYEYAFIDEPKILKIYAQYKSTGGDKGKLKLGIDSTAADIADKWKSLMSDIRVVVDLGPFTEVMWVDGNFNAQSSIKPEYNKPNLQFGSLLQPVVDILQVLQTLTGGDFDKGMDVGMSNGPDNWEYKFNCSKEIPVIKFPSPEQLTINPNPPLKLEAGLRVGFYFNEVISIQNDLKQLVPACGAYIGFYGRLQVQCFTLGVASIYAVGQVNLGIQADTKAGLYFSMKVGFGVELVVGLPVVANVAVLYMVEINIGIGTTALDVGAFMMFRGSAEICGGLVSICIQIEAGGSIHRDFVTEETSCIAQVTFSVDVCVLWVIDINVTETWQESRQIA